MKTESTIDPIEQATDTQSSGYVSFRPRARLLKIIGSELISDEVVALIELVKNAHDADASNVRVRFLAGDEGGPEIHIIDDGVGMDRSGLLGGWMEPAGSTKRGEGRRHTASGRRMLGEKGVGRFAADKLGRRLELFSRPKGNTAEVHAVFDWDAFESETHMLEDVKSRWEIRPATVVPSHGTHLRITGLRNVWTERMYRRLSTRLARLRSPSSPTNSFSIQLESDSFPDYGRSETASYLDHAPYVIDARFDGRRSFSTRVNGKKATSHSWPGATDLTCGPVAIRLHAFDLETDSLAKVGPRAEVRAWLREWSGVSLFRDGYRVWPYGEPHDDWLRLDQRRVNNPVVCLSNNQVVGFVEISQERNPELRDQTNREGLIHNPALEDLRRAVHYVFQLLEAERQAVRHPSTRRTSEESAGGTPKPAGSEALARLSELIDQTPRALRGAMRESLTKVQEQLKARDDYQRVLLRGYAELAAAGHDTTAVLDDVSRVRDSLERLRVRLIHSSPLAAYSYVMPAIDEAVSALERRLALGASSGRSRTAKGGTTSDVGEELQTWLDLTHSAASAAGVTLKVQGIGKQLIRAEIAPRSLHQVLGILSSNSMEWLATRRGRRQITVSVRTTDDDVHLVFGDSGPGIHPDLAMRVFDPFFSTKEGGRGLGLSLARELVNAIGGDIRVLIDGRREGANLLLRIPRKKSRSTPVAGRQ